jgi:hypothetical protein
MGRSLARRLDSGTTGDESECQPVHRRGAVRFGGLSHE